LSRSGGDLADRARRDLYYVYGLAVRVPFACPGLARLAGRRTADVTVEEGPVPARLDGDVVGGGPWDATPGRYLFRGGPRGGRFLVEGGARVVFARGPAARADVLAQQLFDRALPALLRQRRMLVLHANAALTPGGVVAIAGRSGAGKSTALAALLARGCSMVADDVVALRGGDRGGLEALPGPPVLRLPADSVAALGQPVDAVASGAGTGKAAVAVGARLPAGPARLRAVYVLETIPGDEVRVTRLDGARKFDALLGCLYGPVLAREHPDLFGSLARAVGGVDVIRLGRPRGRWTVAEVAGAILGGEARDG
jgi:hypothetical protein